MKTLTYAIDEKLKHFLGFIFMPTRQPLHPLAYFEKKRDVIGSSVLISISN